MLNWNYERWRTRDRLLEYDSNIMPPRPQDAGLKVVYPWVDTSYTVLQHQIFQIAQNLGYQASEPEFYQLLISDKTDVVVGTLATFPIPGEADVLYLDEDTGIVYYFHEFSETVYTERAARIGAAIVGYSLLEDTKTIITDTYIPISAKVLEGTLTTREIVTEYYNNKEVDNHEYND